MLGLPSSLLSFSKLNSLAGIVLKMETALATKPESRLNIHKRKLLFVFDHLPMQYNGGDPGDKYLHNQTRRHHYPDLRVELGLTLASTAHR